MAHVLVGALAVSAGLGGTAPHWEWKVLFLTGFFAAVFGGSAWLFRRAARHGATAAAGAGPAAGG